MAQGEATGNVDAQTNRGPSGIGWLLESGAHVAIDGHFVLETLLVMDELTKSYLEASVSWLGWQKNRNTG